MTEVSPGLLTWVMVTGLLTSGCGAGAIAGPSVGRFRESVFLHEF